MFDLVILDLCMPIMTGKDACINISKLFAEPHLVKFKQEFLVDFDRAKMINSRPDEHSFDILLQHLKPVVVALTSSTL